MTLKACVTARTGQLCSGQGPKEWQLTTPNPVTRKVKCKLIPQICSLQKDLILISGEGWRLGDHSQLWPSQNQDWASHRGIIFRRNVSNQRNPSHQSLGCSSVLTFTPPPAPAWCPEHSAWEPGPPKSRELQMTRLLMGNLSNVIITAGQRLRPSNTMRGDTILWGLLSA